MTFSAEDALDHARKLADRGEPGKARQLYQTILERYPDRAEAQGALAALDSRSARMAALSALQEKGDFAAIIEQGETLALEFPRWVILANLLGIAHAHQGQPERAIAHFTRALSVRPDMAQIHANLGKAQDAAGLKQDAVGSFLAAVQLKPDYADAHFSLGLAMASLARFQDAADCFLRTLTLRPDHLQAEISLGNALRELGRTNEAIDCFQRALKLKPDSVDAHIHLATVHQQQRQTTQAIAVLDRTLALAPERDDARALKLFLAATLCDWQMLARDKAAIPALGIGGKAVQPFTLLALEDDPARHRARAENFARESRVPPPAPLASPQAPPARLKLGYFSADFHNHAVLFQLIRVLELHDREAFEIFAYSYGPEANDAMRERAMKAVDTFRDVRALSSQEIAQVARADGIDIAIDLMGYTRNGRPEIFAHRAAPVQISWLGYPGTLGMDDIDYMIADPVIIPGTQRAHYREKIIFLPHAHMPTDNTRPIADEPLTRRAAGLPETGFVFASFNNSYKITPAAFDVWMRLIAKIEGSVLWLAGVAGEAQDNLKREAQARGIDPQRLIFAERVEMAEHLARHRLADLFLDTFPYGGHSTAADALWAGLPLLARPGEGFSTRVSASLLTAMGLSELIAKSDEDYERIALELAEHPEHLAAIRHKLQESRTRGPVFDSEIFTRDLENGYVQAWRRWFDGEAPADIEAPHK